MNINLFVQKYWAIPLEPSSKPEFSLELKSKIWFAQGQDKDSVIFTFEHLHVKPLPPKLSQ